MTAIRLAIVDDHPLFREGVARSLADMGFDIVGEGASRDDAISLSSTSAPDILLLDISMPGGGLNAIFPVLEKNPAQKIVILTVSESRENAAVALNRGARGYVLKGVGSRSLAAILTSVHAGETYISPALATSMLAHVPQTSSDSPMKGALGSLTERELEILRLVAAGLSNKHVAIQLDLQEKTIKHHMTRVLAKLKARNRTDAAMILRDAESC